MNNTTNTTLGREQSIDQAEKMFKIVFYVVLFVVGTIGNVLVAIIIKNKRRQRTVNDYFIFNLAISDLTFLCFALPFYFYELFDKFVKFQFYCKCIWPMMSVSLFVGIFTLAFMSLERCRAILFPFKPRIKKATLFLGILSIWTASTICIIPLMIVARPEGVMCTEHWPSEAYRKAYTGALFILQFVVPITVIAAAYITIIVKLIKTKVPNRTSVNNRGQLIKQKNRIENIHVIRTVAIIVLLFVACMLPNQVAWILMDFGGSQYKNLSEKFWLFAEALMFLHSCVNPIIYGSLTRQFREGYIKYINFVCCCGRSAQKTMDLSEQRHNQDRQSNSSRPQGRLTHKGSLKSPSIIKRMGAASNTQAATVMSTLTYRSRSSSPTQFNPVLQNEKLGTLKSNIVQNDIFSGAVEVHHNSHSTFISAERTNEKDNHQGVILLPENLQHATEDVKKPNTHHELKEDLNLSSKIKDDIGSVPLESKTDQEQLQLVDKDMDIGSKVKNEHLNDKTKHLQSSTQSNFRHSIKSQNGSTGPESDESESNLKNTINNKERCLIAGPSVNYGIIFDEDYCLRDTHL